MEKKYLDLTGLQDVASHVNTRLKTVTTIPVSADDGAVRLYVGETNVNYTKGHIYQYDLANTQWNDITGSSGGGAVDSVNGKTGNVVLNAKDIGLQYDTMPTASVAYENHIVQYTGTTNASYTNGYFYKCVEDGGVYSWVLVADFALASDVYTKTQVGALTDLPDTSKNIVQNIDTINTAVGDKTDKVPSATNGDLAGLDSNGNLTDSGILATNVIVKSNTTGLVKNDGTIDESTYLTSADIADKADVVSGATNGDLAGLDASGNLTDSGILATDVVQKSSTSGLLKNDGTVDTNTYLTATDISDKANMVSSATNGDLAGLDSNGDLTDSGIAATNVIVKSNTTGLVKNDGTIDTNTYLTSADIADKADVVDGATVDDFATLDASGNLTDSGINKNIVPSNASSSNKLATQSDVASAYRPSGNATLATLPALTEANLNRVYNMTEDFVTTADFAEGAGISVEAGNEVGIIDVSSTSTPDIKYTVLGGFIDLSDYIQKSQTSGLVKNDGSIDTSTYATTTQLAGKADKVASATNGDLAGLDSNGNLTDSGILATNVVTKQNTFGVLNNDGSVRRLDNSPLKNSDNLLVSGGMFNEFTYLIDAMGRMGAINYLDANPTSDTVSGVTFTVNADKSIKVNGTATADIDFEVASMAKLQEALAKDSAGLWGVGKWLRGCPTNGSSNTYCLYYDDDRGNREEDTGDGSQLGAHPATTTPLYLHIGNGTTVNNLMFYPMILDVAVKDFLREYFPYAENNRDLTADILDKADLTDLADAFSESTAYSIGNYVTYDGDLYRFRLNKSAGAWDSTKVVQITVGGEFVTKANLTDLADEFSTGTVYGIGKYITYNGHLYRFTAVHLYGDEWDESKVVRVAVLNDLQQARKDITEKQNLTSFNSTDFFVQEVLIQDRLPQENVSLKRADSVSAGGSGVVSADQVSTALNKTANPEMIAPTFSSSQPYLAGDYVTKLDGIIDAKVKLFRFTANHTGAWTGEDVTEVEVTTVLNNKVDKVSGKGLSTNDYDNTAKGIVDNIQDNVKANTQLISESIWGENGKNLLKNTLVTTTSHGVTATVDDNGIITTSGTSDAEWVSFELNHYVALEAGDYILSGITGGEASTYRLSASGSVIEDFSLYDGEQEFTVTADGTISVTLYVRQSNVSMSGKTFKPMIRKADILDSTYEPYRSSVKDTLREAEVIEGKNLLENTLASKSLNGITYIVNEDKSVTVYGTATGALDLHLHQYTKAEFQKAMGGIGANCILSGCPAGGSTSTYFLRVNGSPWLAVADDTGSGAGFTVPEATSQTEFVVNLSIKSGTNMGTQESPKVFKPMICLATETDPTYEPYYIPLKDSMFPREEQRVLGAKNLLNNYDIKAKSGATVTYTDSGVTCVVSTATTWCGADYTARCNSNTYYDLTLDTIITSGITYVAVQGSTDGTTYTNIKTSEVMSTSGSVDLQFYTGNQTYLKVIFYTTNATTTTCNVTLSSIMLRLASDPDDTYVPFAMTNKQLTDKVVSLDTYLENSSVVLSTSDTTTVTFTSALITANSVIDYACTVWDLVPDDITATTGSCTITLPKVDSAMTVGVRIYIR